MRIKNYLIILLITLILCSPCRQAYAAPSPPDILGGAGILIDNDNGQILYTKEPHKHMYPASTTKILTAILAIENTSLSDMVEIPEEACNVDGSAIGLHEDESISMEDMLYALLLSSGNDCAVAIAVHVGGSVEGFVRMMNAKAAELGAVDSHFNNPNGLPDDNHYTSAYDLSQIAKYAMKNKTFREIVSTQSRVIKRDYPDAQTNMVNSSRLFSRYEGVIGVKTGYTEAAGQCLVAATVRGDRELLSVVLASEGVGIYDDTIALMEYGYNQYEKVSVVEKGTYITEATVKNGSPESVAVAAGQSLDYNIPAGNSGVIEQKVFLYQGITAPVAYGEKLGDVVFYNNNVEIGRADLQAWQDIPRSWVSYWPYAVGFAVFLLAVRIGFYIRRRARRRYYETRRMERERRMFIR